MMEQAKNTAKELLGFLENCPSCYHVIGNFEEILKKEGYTALAEEETWALQPGGKYYMTRGGAALIAFRVPEGDPTGFMISAGHSDRPSFKVKENGLYPSF